MQLNTNRATPNQNDSTLKIFATVKVYTRTPAVNHIFYTIQKAFCLTNQPIKVEVKYIAISAESLRFSGLAKSDTISPAACHCCDVCVILALYREDGARHSLYASA